MVCLRFRCRWRSGIFRVNGAKRWPGGHDVPIHRGSWIVDYIFVEEKYKGIYF